MAEDFSQPLLGEIEGYALRIREVEFQHPWFSRRLSRTGEERRQHSAQ
jgi:hypothetical protein